MKMLQCALGAVAALLIGIGAAHANEFEPYLKDYMKGAEWLGDPMIVAAIEAQNEKNAGLTQADIDALDQTWRAEKESGSGPMIQEVLGNELSEWLKQVKADSNGLIAEVFVMDNKGLNVGQSDPTSDYWQGDEAKFQETYGKGADAMLIDEVEFDDSSESFISQVSRSITDAAGNVIGAITIGINVEAL